MNKKMKLLAAAIPFALMATTLPIHAQSSQDASITAVVEENAQERINLSGKLRMLSQRIPAAACHVNEGIAVDNASALLESATAEFEQILLALEFGDEDLNILMPETRRKSLERIHALRDIWIPFKTAADAAISGSASDADIDLLMTENLKVLSAAQLVVEELVKQYANPNAATRASLMLIDISGRQRMLTQKMSKETCMIAAGHDATNTIESLTGTAQIFEASLEALRFGMPAVGIGPPPNPEIANGLQGVLDDWTSVAPLISDVVAGDTLDAGTHAIKFDALNITMANMNTVVGMYAGAANPNS